MSQAGIEDMAELLEKQLASELSKMTLEEALTLARAFSHHLTLMGIAETHHRYSFGSSTICLFSFHYLIVSLIFLSLRPSKVSQNFSKISGTLGLVWVHFSKGLVEEETKKENERNFSKS